MLSTLLSRRWLGGLALAVALAVAFVLLGTWQWHRRELRLAANAAVADNYDTEPVPLDAALATAGPGGSAAAAGSVLDPAAEWTPVALRGRYHDGDTVLVRNRTLAGRPGYHVLVPFEDASGRVLVVDRGFLPTGQDGSGPDTVPPAPAGDVRVVARLRPPEPDGGGESPPGQVRRIRPADVVAAGVSPPAGDRLVTGAYGVLAAERPSPPVAPVPLPRPEIDEGPHLSYALQWFVFALGAVGVWVTLLRREVRDGTAGPVPARGAQDPPRQPPGRPARRRRPSAEEEEDAAVDAAARQTADRP